jgi:hypothetical protein
MLSEFPFRACAPLLHQAYLNHEGGTAAPTTSFKESIMNIILSIALVLAVCVVLALVIFLDNKVKTNRLHRANLVAARTNGEYDGRQALAFVADHCYDDYEYTLTLAHNAYAGSDLGEAYDAGFKSVVDAGFKNASSVFF